MVLPRGSRYREAWRSNRLRADVGTAPLSPGRPPPRPWGLPAPWARWNEAASSLQRARCSEQRTRPGAPPGFSDRLLLAALDRMRSALPTVLAPALRMARHHHVAAYATLVIAG